jgi:hypothetical protein
VRRVGKMVDVGCVYGEVDVGIWRGGSRVGQAPVSSLNSDDAPGSRQCGSDESARPDIYCEPMKEASVCTMVRRKQRAADVRYGGAKWEVTWEIRKAVSEDVAS